MGEQIMTEYENLELRSEKVRNIIGKVPPELATGGTVYIAFLLFILLIAAAAIPYPENIRTDIVVTSKNREHVYAEAFIPYRYITQIEKGTNIHVTMEGYAPQKYGFNSGEIEAIEDSVISQNGNSYFRVYLVLRTPFKYQVKRDMKGIATITISDNSILQYILGK